jgi:hypothetical protein
MAEKFMLSVGHEKPLPVPANQPHQWMTWLLLHSEVGFTFNDHVQLSTRPKIHTLIFETIIIYVVNGIPIKMKTTCISFSFFNTEKSIYIFNVFVIMINVYKNMNMNIDDTTKNEGHIYTHTRVPFHEET